MKFIYCTADIHFKQMEDRHSNVLNLSSQEESKPEKKFGLERDFCDTSAAL